MTAFCFYSLATWRYYFLVVIAYKMSLHTPPAISLSSLLDEVPETPGPIRARVNNLQNQVSELVRKEHASTVRGSQT